MYHSSGYYNAGKIANPELDDLIERAASLYDIAQRKELYAEIERLVVEDAHIVVPLYGVARSAVNQRVVIEGALYDSAARWHFRDLWVR